MRALNILAALAMATTLVACNQNEAPAPAPEAPAAEPAPAPEAPPAEAPPAEAPPAAPAPYTFREPLRESTPVRIAGSGCCFLGQKKSASACILFPASRVLLSA